MTTFADLGALPATVAALAAEGITRPFLIQEMCLPLALEGHDLIGQAKTGTGKTLGFGIPMLQSVRVPGDDGFDDLPSGAYGKPQGLVVVPTRELCVQVARDLEEAGRLRNVRVLSVYGGRAYEPQVEALRSGVDIVVGTPGRLLDLTRQGHLDLGRVRVLVLDEADEMLDMGFLPDVEAIVNHLPTVRQTMLFSATMPGQIVNLARRYMSQPTHIRASEPDDDRATVDLIEQHVWRTHNLDKPELLARILQAEGRGLAMVFCRTKRTCQKVADDLAERGFAAAAVHGDLGQGAREQALRAFRSGKVDVLVATDVAARGIDVDGVTHVVNYACPEDEKTYLHRVGRTGRAGNSGVAITFVDWDDVPRWQMIDKALGLPFKDPVETYSSSEHVYTGLNIPGDANGRLPVARQVRAGLAAEAVEDLGETGRKPSGTRSKDANRPAHKRGDKHETAKRPSERPSGSGRPKGHDAPKAESKERAARPPRPADAPKRQRRRRPSNPDQA